MTRETKQRQKKFKMKSCQQIVAHCSFSKYGQFGAIQNPDFDHIVCKTYFFINSHLFTLPKLKTELKNLLSSPHTIALSKGTIFTKKCWYFAKNADISKIKRALVLKGIFLKLHMSVYLRTNFQTSSIILTSFIQGGGGGGNFIPNKRTPKNPPRLGLKHFKGLILK